MSDSRKRLARIHIRTQAAKTRKDEMAKINACLADAGMSSPRPASSRLEMGRQFTDSDWGLNVGYCVSLLPVD